MNQTQKNLIHLLTSAVFNKKANISECDFYKLEALASGHCCISIVYQGAYINNMCPPATWKNASMLTVLNNYKNLEVQKKITAVLFDNGISCAVIKGITAAANYAYPMCRALGDIDVLVLENDYEKALSLFGHTPDERTEKFHTAFSFEGVSVEIHKSIDDYQTGFNGKKLSEQMKSALEDIEFAEFEAYRIPQLKNKYKAVVYLNHMYRHFLDNELNMRMFCDWAAFVNSVDSNTWHSCVYPFIEKTGLHLFADALNSCVLKYMEADVSEKIVHTIKADVVNQLMEELVSDGTKSGKEFIDGNIANTYEKNSNDEDGVTLSALGVLNAIAKRKFSIAKHKIFLPFCWLYIALSYLAKVITGKRSFISYKKINSTIERRKIIKNELELK